MTDLVSSRRARHVVAGPPSSGFPGLHLHPVQKGGPSSRPRNITGRTSWNPTCGGHHSAPGRPLQVSWQDKESPKTSPQSPVGSNPRSQRLPITRVTRDRESYGQFGRALPGPGAHLSQLLLWVGGQATSGILRSSFQVTELPWWLR